MRWQAGWALRTELGQQRAAVVLRLADDRFVAPPRLAKTGAGAFNLEMAAYLLALRDALTEMDFGERFINDLLTKSLYRVMRRFYRPMDALAIAIHPSNGLARARWRQRVSRRLFFRSPDWHMAEVAGVPGYGFDVRRCLMAEYMRSRGEQRFCREVVCSQDLLMAQARGEELARTLTIAAGDDRCDFRFAA